MREVDFPTRGPGLSRSCRAPTTALRDATKLWLADNIALFEDGTPLPPPRDRPCAHLAAVRQLVRLATSRRARTSRAAPLADDLELYWNQQLLDVLLRVCRSLRPLANSSIQPRFDRLGLQRLDGAALPAARTAPTRAFELHGDPGLVRLDPRWHQAALALRASPGFWHILEGTDHLLFLVCLVIPFRRLRPLVLIVTVVHRRAFDHADRVRASTSCPRRSGFRR